MRGRKTPEIDEKTVPGPLLNVSVLEGFESEICSAPGEGSDNVTVCSKDVKRATLLPTGQVKLENSTRIVVGAFARQYGTSCLEELYCAELVSS